MEEEIWKDINSFEDIYQISNLGRVKSLNYNKEKILKPGKCTNGYLNISLYKNNIRKDYRIHRLVANSFIPNPENKSCVDHINTIRTDNRIENLRWVTHSENNNNPISLIKFSKSKLGTIISEEHKEKISKPVLQYYKSGKFIKEWKSIKETSRKLNISDSNISQCCLGNRN